MKQTELRQKKRPSRITIPAGFLFISQGQAAARRGLGGTLSEGINFVAICARLGSGKTTLLEQFARHLSSEITFARLDGYRNSAENFLYEVLAAFKQNHDGLNHSEILKALFDFLLQQQVEKKKPLLIIDNAETLDHDTLKAIQSLTELRSEGEVLIRIVLSGDTDLIANLDRPEFSSLTLHGEQLIRIEPFNQSETEVYLQQRYQQPGTSQRRSFTQCAARLINNYSHGNPLAINKLSSWALKLAEQKQKHKVTHYFARKALETPAWALFSERLPASHAGKSLPSSDPTRIPKVTVFLSNKKTGEYHLGKKVLLLGRSLDNGITLQRPGISRRHACLTILDSQVWIKNLASTNKTYVNTKPVMSHPLNDGDIIRIDDFLLLFTYESPAPTELTQPNKAMEPESGAQAKTQTQTQIKRESENKRTFRSISGSNAVKPPKAPTPSEKIVALEPGKIRKRQTIPAHELRRLREQRRARRRLQMAVAGSIALFGPIVAVILLSNSGNNEAVSEVSAGMVKTATIQVGATQSGLAEKNHLESAKIPEKITTQVKPEPTAPAQAPVTPEHIESQTTKSKDSGPVTGNTPLAPLKMEIETKPTDKLPEKNMLSFNKPAQQISSKSRRDSRIENLIRLARRQQELGNLVGPAKGNATDTYFSILDLNPSDSRAQRGLEEISDYFHVQAKQFMDRSNPLGSLGMIEQGLSVKPSHHGLRQLQNTALQQLRQRRDQRARPGIADGQMKDLIAKSRQHLQGGELSTSLSLIEQGLKLDPDNRMLQQLRRETIKSLAVKEQQWSEKEQRQLRISRIISAAKQLKKKGELDKSLELVDQGLEISPHHSELLELRSQFPASFTAQKSKLVRQQKLKQQVEKLQTERFLSQAKTKFNSGELKASLQLIEKGLNKAPNHKELFNLRQQVTQQRKQREQAYAGKAISSILAGILAQAKQKEISGDLPASIRLIETGLAIDPDHPGLLEIQAKLAAHQ